MKGRAQLFSLLPQAKFRQDRQTGFLQDQAASDGLWRVELVIDRNLMTLPRQQGRRRQSANAGAGNRNLPG